MSDYLLPEVVNEILKRLPVESLLRFRCVCKDWCSLISSPNFISQQLSHSSSSSTHSRTLVRYYSELRSKEIYTIYDEEYSFNSENSTNIAFPFHKKSKYYYHIVGYCNGLLCLSDDLFGCRMTNVFVLWNPSIRRAVTLPTPNVYLSCRSFMLALGFGFDFINNDYKIVRLAYFLNDDISCHKLPPVIDVFSLSTGIWRRLNNNVECYISDHCWSQAFIHGAVHWVSFKMTRNGQFDRRHRNLILKFDLSSEKFVELGLPEDLAGVPPVKLMATTVKGRLSIVYNDIWMNDMVDRDVTNSCAIWVMREYNNVKSWALVFRVRLDTEFNRVLDVKKSGILFCGRNEEPFIYNFQNRVATSTGLYGTTHSFFVDKYVESLVLIGNGKEVRETQPDSDYEDVFKTVGAAETRRFGTKTREIYSLYLE